jgi:hypothetical protein
MKFNQLTCQIALAILVITALYTLLYSGLTGVLFCGAVGLIAAAFVDEFELVAAITVIFALFYTLFLKRFLRRLEPFTNHNNSQSILKRVSSMQQQYHPVQQELTNPRREPYGVYDPSIEGFADVSETKSSNEKSKEGAPSESSSASTKSTVNQVNPQEVKDVTAAISKDNKKTESEEFQSATGNLFKVGQMPSEHSDGPKLDPAQTIMKAMNSLDPKTITNMTTDTKQLLETQKSLMGMLQQMRPVLSDGKELLQTFSNMFGGNNFALGK